MPFSYLPHLPPHHMSVLKWRVAQILPYRKSRGQTVKKWLITSDRWAGPKIQIYAGKKSPIFGLINGTTAKLVESQKLLPQFAISHSCSSSKMRIFYVLNIGEKRTQFFGCLRIPNRALCLLLGMAQFLVVGCSLFQHIYSWSHFGHVFKCNSNISASAGWEERLLAYDPVIFDFGLMNRVLKMNKCVANYLDGGYLRFSWCVEHTSALLLLLIVLCFNLKRIWLYWPALFMQSAFVLGMAILTMATTPKMLEAMSAGIDRRLGIAFCVYVTGVAVNWMFTLVLWHHYWAEEAEMMEAKRRAAEREDEGGRGGTTVGEGGTRRAMFVG